MTTLLHEPATLDQAARTARGLLSSAVRVPAGIQWQPGLRVRWIGCTEPQLLEACAVADTDPEALDTSAFDPVWIRQSALCSTLSLPQDDADAAARERLESTTEWSLGRALWTGEGTNNPALDSATPVAASLLSTAAVSCLEQAIADTGFGARAFLHAPPRAAAYLAEHHLIDIDGFSPAGHRWVISPGYPSAAADTTVTIVATGTTWVAADPVEVLSEPSMASARQNASEAWGQRLGIALFDPCLLLSATFQVEACTP